MLVLSPRRVSFGAASWSGVASISVDRQASRLVEDPGDAGPYVVFADAPEQRVRVRVVQELAADELSAPRPGEQAVLSFTTAPVGPPGGPRRRVSMTAAVVGVTHEMSMKRGATRTIELTAISPTGSADPIAIADAPESEP